MTAQYMVKSARKNGEARKRPCLFVRILKGIFPVVGDSVGTVIRKLVFLAALAAFIITAAPVLIDLTRMYIDEFKSKGISSIYVTNNDDNNNGAVTGEILPSFRELLAINPDTVGYLRIEGTAIDYPVVKTDNNDFYLTHDFWKQESRSGCVMMDYKCSVEPGKSSANTVLYGHNMAAGTFFAALSEYWRTCHDSYTEPSMEFYKNHPTITFDTLYEKSEWKIFAIDLFNTEERYGEVYNYNNRNYFYSREEFNNFIIDIMNRSDVLTDVDIKYGDDILTLSTCYWPYRSNMENVRLAIFARKVRKNENESKSVNVDAVRLNPLPVRWQWVYENVGGDDKHTGVWDRRKLLSYTEEDAARDGYVFQD